MGVLPIYAKVIFQRGQNLMLHVTPINKWNVYQLHIKPTFAEINFLTVPYLFIYLFITWMSNDERRTDITVFYSFVAWNVHNIYVC